MVSPIDKNSPSIRSAPESIEAAESARPRRRLGNWLTAGAAEDVPEHESAPDQALVGAVTPDVTLTATRPATGVSISQRRQGRDLDENPPAPKPAPLAKLTSVAPAQPSRLEALIVHVQANPDDVTALGVLADALQDHGMIQESRDIQNRLAALKANAQRSADEPQTESAPTVAPGSIAPIRAPRIRRGGTTQLLHNPVLPTMLTGFPLDELGFTIPLPGESRLTAEVREIVEQAGRELAAGHLMAAFDSCVQVIERAPDFTPNHVRLAEIHAHRRSAQRARTQAQAVVRLCDVEGHREDVRWMAQRVLLHASESDFDALKTLVDSLIVSNRINEAARYGVKLVEISLNLGNAGQALAISNRLCDLAPGDERLALENVILLAHAGDSERAIDRWKHAVAEGARESVAKSSLAALIADGHELDHWQLLAESIEETGSTGGEVDAGPYIRTAAAIPAAPAHAAGRAILQAAANNEEAAASLVATMSDPGTTDLGRVFAAVIIAQKLDHPERVKALLVAVSGLQKPSRLDDSVWLALVGAAPRLEDLEVDLGETLLQLGDGAGSVEVLKRALARDPQNAGISALLADALVRAGQLGAGLAVLDGLAIAHRSAGRLEEMAGVLRKMSALAPTNLKVKTRLIEAYLQRGFVDEARTELVAKANLQESSGLLQDAAISLQRSADLSWGLGEHEEAYATYRRLIDLAPDDAGNRSTLVNLYLQNGRIAEAAEQQRAVVEISIRTGSRHEAIAALHQVIGLTPDDSTAYYQLGELLDEMGEHHQAEKVYRRLALMNPGDTLAREKTVEMAGLAHSRTERAEAPAR